MAQFNDVGCKESKMRHKKHCNGEKKKNSSFGGSCWFDWSPGHRTLPCIHTNQSSILKREAAGSSETVLLICQTTLYLSRRLILLLIVRT